MSGLQKIVDKIKSSAQSEVDAIIDKANNQAKDILDKGESAAKKHVTEIDSQADVTIKNIVSSVDSQIGTENRQIILREKQNLMSKVISDAHQSFANLPEDQYFAIFSKLASQVDVGGNAEVLLNEKDKKRVTDSFLKSFPNDLTVKVSEQPIDILGGFILKTNTVTINCSIEELFSSNRNEILDIVNNNLFV